MLSKKNLFFIILFFKIIRIGYCAESENNFLNLTKLNKNLEIFIEEYIFLTNPKLIQFIKNSDIVHSVFDKEKKIEIRNFAKKIIEEIHKKNSKNKNSFALLKENSKYKYSLTEYTDEEIDKLINILLINLFNFYQISIESSIEKIFFDKKYIKSITPNSKSSIISECMNFFELDRDIFMKIIENRKNLIILLSKKNNIFKKLEELIIQYNENDKKITEFINKEESNRVEEAKAILNGGIINWIKTSKTTDFLKKIILKIAGAISLISLLEYSFTGLTGIFYRSKDSSEQFNKMIETKINKEAEETFTKESKLNPKILNDKNENISRIKIQIESDMRGSLYKSFANILPTALEYIITNPKTSYELASENIKRHINYKTKTLLQTEHENEKMLEEKYKTGDNPLIVTSKSISNKFNFFSKIETIASILTTTDFAYSLYKRIKYLNYYKKLFNLLKNKIKISKEIYFEYKKLIDGDNGKLLSNLEDKNGITSPEEFFFINNVLNNKNLELISKYPSKLNPLNLVLFDEKSNVKNFSTLISKELFDIDIEKNKYNKGARAFDLSIEKFIGMIDLLLSKKKLYEKTINLQIKNSFSLPNFIKSDYPILKIKDGWRSEYSETAVANSIDLNKNTNRNMIIAGPTKSGKTEIGKMAAEICYLSNCGITSAKQIDITPFEKIFIMIDLPYIKGESKNSRENTYLRYILKKTNSEKKFSITVYDEILSGTTEEQSAASIKNYEKNLLQNENNISIITTHMYAHLSLASNQLNSLKKYFIKVIRDKNNNDNFIKLFEIAEDKGDNWWFGAKNQKVRDDYALWAEGNYKDL
jgi:hypothetical protein